MLQSFDFSQIAPEQVLQLFQTYLAESRSVLDVLLTNGRQFEAGVENKYQWLQSQFTPQAWALGGTSYGATAFNTPATMLFNSTAKLDKNDILAFQDPATGLDAGNMQVIVLNVLNGTQATVQLYGGTTGVALTGNEKAIHLSETVKENEKGIEGQDEWTPIKEYNFFQIFRTSVELSDTAIKSAVHGNVNLIAKQLENAFYRIRQQMSSQLVRGRRVARDGVNPGNGSFGGFLQYLAMSGGNALSASGNLLDPVMLNDMIAMIDMDGGSVDTVICGVDQARKISAFNRNGATGQNVYTMIDQASKDVGSYAMRFISDIPVAGGLISNIIVDHKMPKDQIGLVKLSNIGLVPFTDRGVKLVDGTQNGQDGQTAILRGEYTLACRDLLYSGGLITDLSL